MTAMVDELYTALRALGLEDDLAKKAAKAVVSIEDKQQLVTKADLAEVESRIIKWNIATMGILTGIWTAIGIALRVIRP